MSAHARVLSANELGCQKLRHAQKHQLWPVEVAFKSSDQLRAGQLSASVSSAHIHEREDEHQAGECAQDDSDNTVEIELERSAAANALWTAFVPVPPGELMYTINALSRNDHESSRTIAVGSLFVSPPSATQNNSNTVHSPLYYRIISHTRACAAVHFLFHPVPIDCGAIFLEFRGESIRLKSTNADDTNNSLYISPIILVPYDAAFQFSFRVNLRKNKIHPRDAPLTHLGWDPSKSHSGALVTWENTISVQKPQRPFPLVPALLLAVVAVTIRKAFRQRLRKTHSGDVD